MFVKVVAFVSAAVIALINHLVMNGSTTFDEEKARKLMKNWGPAAVSFSRPCSVIFIWVKFIKEAPPTRDVENTPTEVQLGNSVNN